MLNKIKEDIYFSDSNSENSLKENNFKNFNCTKTTIFLKKESTKIKNPLSN